jgi:hypothetical protein
VAPAAFDHEVFRAARIAVAKGWWRMLAIGHLTLLAWFVAYLAVVAFNSLAFEYSFWNDAPPSDAADTVAVLTLWGLLAGALAFGSVAYCWMCALALDAASLTSALRRAVGPWLRSCWFAAPLFGITTCTVALVVPGVAAVGLLSLAPLVALRPAIRPADIGRFIAAEWPTMAVIGMAAIPLGVALWATVLLCAAASTASPALATLVGWTGLGAEMIGMGAVASASVHVYERGARALEPGVATAGGA